MAKRGREIFSLCVGSYQTGAHKTPLGGSLGTVPPIYPAASLADRGQLVCVERHVVAVGSLDDGYGGWVVAKLPPSTTSRKRLDKHSNEVHNLVAVTVIIGLLLIYVGMLGTRILRDDKLTGSPRTK